MNPEGEGGREDPISIERVVLLPLDNWSPDFIFPTSSCVQGSTQKCKIHALNTSMQGKTRSAF